MAEDAPRGMVDAVAAAVAVGTGAGAAGAGEVGTAVAVIAVPGVPDVVTRSLDFQPNNASLTTASRGTNHSEIRLNTPQTGRSTRSTCVNRRNAMDCQCSPNRRACVGHLGDSRGESMVGCSFCRKALAVPLLDGLLVRGPDGARVRRNSATKVPVVLDRLAKLPETTCQ